MVINILLILFGFVLLIKGADYLVDGASNIAKKFHIPEIIIGLTVVSTGTSMPELFVSSTSALNGLSDMSIGNIIGSNICNLLLILGLSALIKPVDFQRETRLIEIPMCFFITVLFAFFCNTDNVITRVESGILLFLFVLFISYTIYMGRKGQEFDNIKETRKDKREEKKISIQKNIFLVTIGIFFLKVGGDFTVDNAREIAEIIGLSEKVIGLTILAIGTSLPELVTSVTAAVKGNSDIAIGNIIGSNIFNILFIIGVSSMISPITYNQSYNLQLAILLFSMLLLSVFPFIGKKNQMSRDNGFIYLMLYIVYMVLLFFI